MTVVELRNATKIFADATIDVTLRADSGKQLVLLGPSGSGKSTVLRMIAGLTTPDSGGVSFDGEQVEHLAPERRQAAMVFQAPALFPFRTVLENVEYGLKVRKVKAELRRSQALEALAAVHLDGFADRWPNDLSGGEQQRVSLARSIVLEPRVLLLDEPLSSLDPVLRAELQELICEVQSTKQITSIFVTHDRAEAFSVGHDVAVMLDGRVEQVGPTEQVFSSPASDRVAHFLGAAEGIAP